MAFKKGKPRHPKAGRKKGTPNKIPIAAKQAMLDAFAAMGGVDGLVAWAARNKTEFYKIWSKTLPRDLNVSGMVGITRPDMSHLTDEDLANLDAIYDRAAKREQVDAGANQSGASSPQPS